MIIAEWLFQEPFENKSRKKYSPKPLKRLARNKIKLDDKQLNKKIAEKMNNIYYLTDGALQVGFDITSDSHLINHSFSKLTIITNLKDIGIGFQYIIEILNKMANICARLINQYKYNYQTLFSPNFDKQDEYIQTFDETELITNVTFNQNLAEFDINTTDTKSSLEHQIQNQEFKDCVWRSDRINSMTLFFYKTIKKIGSPYRKFSSISSVFLNIENDKKYCSLWSISTSLHPCSNNHPNRVSNYRQYLKELNFDEFEFSNVFNCNGVQKSEKLKNLFINLFELQIFQEQNKWNHKLLPIEISKSKSDNIVDLIIYKTQYVLVKKTHKFLCIQNCKFACRRCLSSYTEQSVLLKHKQRCEQQEITGI